MTGARIRLVALHVFRECVRDRVLYSIVAFAVLLVGASVLIGEITAGQDLKILKDLGLAAIELAGLAISIFIGVGLVSREIERRSVHSLLAKPLPRWEFIVGKFAGLVATIVVNVGLMTMVLYALLAWIGARAPEELRRAWDAPAADPALLIAVVFIVAQLAMLTAVALFFSTFSSSGLLSVIMTIGVWIAGVESADLRSLAGLTHPIGPIVSWLGWLLPAFAAFDVKALVVHGQPIPLMFVAWRLVYAASYSAVLLAAGVVIFSRREFQ